MKMYNCTRVSISTTPWSRRIVPLILKLGIWWRPEVSLTPLSVVPLVPIGWAAEPVWTLWRREKSLPCGESNPGRPDSHYIELLWFHFTTFSFLKNMKTWRWRNAFSVIVRRNWFRVTACSKFVRWHVINMSTTCYSAEWDNTAVTQRI
jgi:hypothetical protein